MTRGHNNLSLIGGKPTAFKPQIKSINSTYNSFMDMLPLTLDYSRCQHPSRRGYASKTVTGGLWLYQTASSLQDLKSEHDYWTALNEFTYKDLKKNHNGKILLIHSSDQEIPFAIEAKVQALQAKPSFWNDWSLAASPVPTTRGLVTLPPPEFHPASVPHASLSLDLSVACRPISDTEVSLPVRVGQKRPASQTDSGEGLSKRQAAERHYGRPCKNNGPQQQVEDVMVSWKSK